jgi:hypothetical protein
MATCFQAFLVNDLGAAFRLVGARCLIVSRTFSAQIVLRDRLRDQRISSSGLEDVLARTFQDHRTAHGFSEKRLPIGPRFLGGVLRPLGRSAVPRSPKRLAPLR